MTARTNHVIRSVIEAIRNTNAHSSDDLLYARLAARCSVQDVAWLAGVHRSTIERQEAGQTRVSRSTLLLLDVLSGAMPWPGWAGWRIVEGALCGDGRAQGYTVADLRAYEWQAQQITALRHALAHALGSCTAPPAHSINGPSQTDAGTSPPSPEAACKAVGSSRNASPRPRRRKHEYRARRKRRTAA